MQQRNGAIVLPSTPASLRFLEIVYREGERQRKLGLLDRDTASVAA